MPKNNNNPKTMTENQPSSDRSTIVVDNNNNNIDIPSSDILHLIQSHLIECGLSTTSSTLRSESGGIGLPGLFPASKGSLLLAAESGRWGEVLRLLDNLDFERCNKSYCDDYYYFSEKYRHHGNEDGGDSLLTTVTPLQKAVAMVHEMAVLELAEQNEIELAYATLRMSSELIDGTLSASGEEDSGEGEMQIPNNTSSSDPYGTYSSSRSGDIERRIAALIAMRNSTVHKASSDYYEQQQALLLPPNYYGPSNRTRQKRRDQITKLLRQYIPEIPLKRLTSLLQQSIKWQCHTGVFPTVQRLFHHATEEDEDDDDDEKEGGGVDDETKRTKDKRKKKKRKKNVVQKFDLVLGNIDIANNGDGKTKRMMAGDSETINNNSVAKRIPSRVYQTIRLGKRSYIESACFLPDGRGIVTGSSDGFIEIWGEPLIQQSTSSNNDGISSNITEEQCSRLNRILSSDIDYEKLRITDLAYQRSDDLMMHEPMQSVLAMNISHDGAMLGTTSLDGTVYIWKISDGKLLRKIKRAHGGFADVNSDKGAAVTCIQFSPDGSKILTGGHDSTCREFGLLSSKMLKEFRGHSSYVNCCSYVVLPQPVSNDGGDSRCISRRVGNNNWLAVITGSADGTVRVWDGRTAEPIQIINPSIIPMSASSGTMHSKDFVAGSKSIHTILHLHTPPNTMIVVPRCERAYLISCCSGAVLRSFTRDDRQGGEFLAAAVSPSNQFLFIADGDGECLVFDVSSGKMEKMIRSFAADCTICSSSSSSGEKGDKKPCEISGLICHPHQCLIGGYSNDKRQKRGMLTLWK